MIVVLVYLYLQLKNYYVYAEIKNHLSTLFNYVHSTSHKTKKAIKPSH